MAVISPSVPIMSLFVIYRSSSLLWLRRRTCCGASVPVTGGSVSAELLHRQLDLVTGIAAHLSRRYARACTVRPCPWSPCRTSTRSGTLRGSHCPEASGRCRTSRHLGRTASRGVPSHRHVPRTAAAAPPAVEVEVLYHWFSALAASDVPACTRVFARALPACCQCGAVCRISHSSHGYRTWLSLLHRPASAGRCGLPRQARRTWFPIWARPVLPARTLARAGLLAFFGRPVCAGPLRNCCGDLSLRGRGLHRRDRLSSCVVAGKRADGFVLCGAGERIRTADRPLTRNARHRRSAPV